METFVIIIFFFFFFPPLSGLSRVQKTTWFTSGTCRLRRSYRNSRVTQVKKQHDQDCSSGAEQTWLIVLMSSVLFVISLLSWHPRCSEWFTGSHKSLWNIWVGVDHMTGKHHYVATYHKRANSFNQSFSSWVTVSKCWLPPVSCRKHHNRNNSQ